MLKKNFFTAALESEASSTIDPDEIHTLVSFQPKKLGVAEGDDEPSEEKPTKEIGVDTPGIAEHDEIDTVAESQEHVLALEHLQSTSMRYCRMAAALEEIADTAEQKLEAGEPMDPATVGMLTSAIDASGVGAPMQDTVALEAFMMDASVATEGFIDAIKERAQKVWAAVAKFAKKAMEVTGQKLKRFADYFRSLPAIYAKLEKEGEVLASNANKPFQNEKWEKSLQNSFYAPASTKTVLSAVANAQSEFKEVTAIAENRLHGELRALNNAWSQDKPEAVVAQMNKVLATARLLTEVGSTKFKHSGLSCEVNLPDRISIEGTAGLEGTKVTYEEGIQQFSAGIKTASMADISQLKTSAQQAERVILSAIDDLFNGKLFEVNYKARHDFTADDKGVARKLLSKYVNLVRVVVDLAGGAVYGSASGFYGNHSTAARWVRYSIAEAKAAKRGDAK